MIPPQKQMSGMLGRPVAERDRGCRIVDGVEMLVQLAMQIFEQWTGIAPDEKVFQRAVAAVLGEEARPAPGH